MKGAISARRSTRPTARGVSTAAGARFARLDDGALIEPRGRRPRGRQGGGLVPGADGVRPARARQPLDPRATRDRPTMQSALNLKVKYREVFRPFAPAVLREDVADWFELDSDSPYMLLVADVVKRRRRVDDGGRNRRCSASTSSTCRARDIPAVTHVDYSARVQTVHAETNPRFHALLSRVQGADRLSGAGQHQLQRARRADRPHARGRLPLLHGDRDRRARGRQLLSAQGATRIRRSSATTRTHSSSTDDPTRPTPACRRAPVALPGSRIGERNAVLHSMKRCTEAMLSMERGKPQRDMPSLLEAGLHKMVKSPTGTS